MKKLALTVCMTFALGFMGYNLYSKFVVMPVGAEASSGLKVASSEDKIVSVDGLMPERNKTELVGSSELIVKGVVKEILPSKWTNPNGEKKARTCET